MPAKTDNHIRNVRLRFGDDIRAMKQRTGARLSRPRTDALGSALAALIDTYVNQHGYGPSRREAVAAAGLNAELSPPPTGLPLRFLPQWQAEGVDLIFLHLRQAGWICYSHESRSLRPGPKAAARRRTGADVRHIAS